MSNDFSQSLTTYSMQRAWSNSFEYFILNNEPYLPLIGATVILLYTALEYLCRRGSSSSSSSSNRPTTAPWVDRTQTDLKAELSNISRAITSLEHYRVHLVKQLDALKPKRG